MKTIWKFELRTTTAAQEVHLPWAADVLCVREQHGVPCLWALVDPQAAPAPRLILTFPTGDPCGAEVNAYLGSYFLAEGAFVFHVFDGGWAP